MNGIALIQNGRSDYVIVHPENASPSNVTAAKELQKYLELISGVVLPIRTDADVVSRCEILVGYTNRSKNDGEMVKRLGKDGFIIKTVGEQLFILGSGVRGALYGVYELLEKYLDCRFYTSEYERIPSKDSVVIPFIECDEQVPVFEYRHIDLVTSRKKNFQAKLKSNGTIDDKAFGGRVTYTGFVHTFNNLVPPSVYGEEHPEYWGVNEDGTPQTHWGRQLCLTNPDVLRIVKDSVRRLLRENPNTDIISISQNDTGGDGVSCQCAKCRAVYEEEGAYSGAYVRFLNEIASEFADEYPNVKFDTLAYRFTRSVCKTHPADNVIIRLCTIECCFSHPLGTCRDVYKKPGSKTSIAEDIAAWGRITKNVYVWDYVTNFAHPTVMFPNFNTLLPNAKFFADHSVKGLFEEGNYFSDTGDFSDLRAYIMAKVLWDPYMSEDKYWAYIEGFLRGVYGEGWKYIREYIDAAQDIVKDRHFGIYYAPEQIFFDAVRHDDPLPTDITLEKIRNYETTDWSRYFNYAVELGGKEFLDRGDELFASALELADDAQAERIDKIKLQLDFLKSYFLRFDHWYKRQGVDAVVKKFFAETDEGRAIDDAERAELSDKIFRHLRDRVCGEERVALERYNRELCIRGLKHGVVQYKEGRKKISSETEISNFLLEPCIWI